MPTPDPGSPRPRARRLKLDIHEQPDDTTCGPTALHAVYRYHGDAIDIEDVIAEVPRLPNGGTLSVLLGCHALQRGYQATIFTYNLQLFDPTWFHRDIDLEQRLRRQRDAKGDAKLRAATQAYLEFLQRGGRVRFDDRPTDVIRGHLESGRPILTGLSATYLYRASRENERTNEPDDVGGYPVGHFVILSGYDEAKGTVTVSDPWGKNPLSRTRRYTVRLSRAIGAIFLGALTYDANLLVLRPPGRAK